MNQLWYQLMFSSAIETKSSMKMVDVTVTIAKTMVEVDLNKVCSKLVKTYHFLIYYLWA